MRHAVLKCVLYSAIGALTILYLSYVFARPTRWYNLNKDFIQWRAGFDVPYQNVTLAHGKRTPAMMIPATRTIQILIPSGCTLVVALCVCALMYNSNRTTRSGSQGQSTRSNLFRQFRVLLAHPLPPRGLWTWWCGGLSVMEGILIACWLAVSVVWFYEGYLRGLNAARAQKKAGESWTSVKFEKAGARFGAMFMPNYMALFYPVPHSTFLHWLTGKDFPQLIKYHRWLGYGTLLMSSIHGLMFWGLWWYQGEWIVHGLEWGVYRPINNLAGGLCFLVGLLVLGTTLPQVRRRSYQLFYRTHLGSFLLFVTLSTLHNKNILFWATPALTLYLIDLAFRMCQYVCNKSYITKIAISGDLTTLHLQWHLPPHGTKEGPPVTTLPLCCPIQPTQTLFLQVPSVSRWQWHPFTVAAAHLMPSANGNIVVTEVHMKKLGPWTRQLADKVKNLSAGPDLEVKVQGPYGSGHEGRALHYSTVVLAAGGIGVTPLLGLLQLVVHLKRTSPQAGPKQVYLIWSSRQIEDFTLLDQELLEHLREGGKDGWLHIALHHTGPNLPAVSTVKEIGDDHNLSRTPGRPLLPHGLGPLHYALACVLAFCGCFAGILVGCVYEAHFSNTTTRGPNNLYVTLLWLVAIPLGIILPVMAVSLPRYVGMRTSRCSQDSGMKHAPKLQLLSDNKVGMLEGGRSLEVSLGRPDWSVLLTTILETQRRAGVPGPVGVFLGGPEVMVKSVEAVCQEINEKRSRVDMEVHHHTFIL